MTLTAQRTFRSSLPHSSDLGRRGAASGTTSRARAVRWLPVAIWVVAVICAGSLLSVAVPLSARTRSLVVIAHPGVRVHEVSLAELRAIFTGRQRHFSSGVNAIPFNAGATSHLRVNFDRAVLGLDADAVARFWIDQRIRGGSRAPRQIVDRALIPRVVARLLGAISYTYDDEPHPGVLELARVVDGAVLPPRKGSGQ